MLFQDPIEMFLKYFNEIDKHFDIVLNQDKFSPFNEKLKEIWNWDYAVSNYVKKYRKILKHFGELRNELIHGGKIWWKALITPTKETISELKKHKVVICNPPSVGKIFHNKDIITIKNGKKENKEKYCYFCKEKISKKDFSNKYYTPILNNDWEIVNIISTSNIVFIEHNKEQEKTQKEDFFEDHNITYKIVSDSFLLLEVQHFYQHCAKKGLQWVLVITKNGKDNEKIEWIITPFNYARIFKYL